MLRLKDKVAIITGGNSGIGKATSVLFAKEGANVVIVARDNKLGKKVVDEIIRNKGKAIFIKTDVSVEVEIQRMVQEVMKKFGKIDILYNNAGIELQKDVVNTSFEEFEKVLHINLGGVFLCSKYVIPQMKKGGVIVNTASVAGIVGFPNLAAYCASKGAIVLLTKEMALDYATKGIRVNAVCPGAIDTPMIKRFVSKAPDIKEARKDLVLMHPMQRMGKPEEIANAVLFLTSDESSFVTGQALCVDGGLTAQ